MATLQLIDDEEIGVRDREAARLTFGRIRSDTQPQLNAAGADVRVHVCLNLTPLHFKEGACTFDHLTPEGRDMFYSWTNALGHATDQKRPTPTGRKNNNNTSSTLSTSTMSLNQSQGRKKQKKHKKKRTKESELRESEASEESTQDAEEDGSDASENTTDDRMDGAQHLGVFIETLFDQQWRVVGYRLHCMDASAHKTRVDLMTRAMQRSIKEGKEIQEQIKTELARLRRATPQGNGKRTQNARTYEANPRYRWAQPETEEQYVSVVRGYFLADTLRSSVQPRSHTQSGLDRMLRDSEIDDMEGNNEDDEDERLARQAKPVFTDPRPFMHQSLFYSNESNGSIQRQNQKRLDMPHLFSKEQAMVYHVEAANVRLEQRTLSSYYSPYSGRVEKELEQMAAVESERRQKHDRLERLMKEGVGERQFHHFPFPNTTYRIDPSNLSMELMASLPLPHRIGSVLYNQSHRSQVEKQVRRQRKAANQSYDNDGGDDDDYDMSDEDERLSARPLGLHDVQTDVTPGLLHQHQDLLGDELRNYLTTRHVPHHLAQIFLTGIRNTVERELNSIRETLREPKTDLVETRIGGQLVPPATVQFRQLFRAQTPASVVDNRHKQYLLDRRVGQEVGHTDDTLMREREKALARADINFYRSRLGKWRKTNTTLETVIQECATPKHEPVFIDKDYALVLDCLNDLGYSKIQRKYIDPATGQVRVSQLAQYKRDTREYMEAALVEFWEHFFESPKVSHAGAEIRKDLRQNLARGGYHGRVTPIFPFDVQARIYHQYKLQLYKYFSDYAGITYHYKIMDALWHAACHHCRYYQPGCKDCKLSIIMGGDGDVGKSFRLDVVKKSMPPGVCESVSRMTHAALLTGQNFSDFLILSEEMAAELVGSADSKGDTRVEDARNIHKEVKTNHQTTTMAYHQDDEGNRMYKMHKSMCQSNTLGATNINMAKMDQSVASRHIIFAVPGTTGQVEGTSAHEKEKQPDGQSKAMLDELLNQKKYEREVYYMVELLTRSGVSGDSVFGVEVGGARILINKILDQMQREYGVATHKPRKRKHVLEMARVLCIASTVWYVLVAPELRHLQHDPVTGVFIGLNPRVLLAIIDRLVITTDHVVDALTMLSGLWSHDYQDTILENFALNLCKLDETRKKDFIHREGVTESVREALETSPLTWYHQKQTRQPTWSLNAPTDSQLDHIEIDYNYITVSAKSFEEIHRRLSETDRALRISLQDTDRMLTSLAATTILCDAYEPMCDANKQILLDEHGNPLRLVRSKDKSRYRERRVLDKGKNADNLHTYALSTAYCKRKLPHLLPDTRIQNLDVPDDQDSFLRTQLDEEEHDSEDQDVMDAMNDGVMLPVDEATVRLPTSRSAGPDAPMIELRQRLQAALSIERGDANETTVIKAIRDVLEYDALGWTGRGANVEEEEALMASYGDVITGESPCVSYVTAEHPLSLPADTVFGDLVNPQQQTMGGKKSHQVPREIAMVDMPATITLKRNPNRSLVEYNFMTVSDLTRASLSIYQQQNGMGNDENVAADEINNNNSFVQNKRVALYASSSTFVFDRDIDYIYCEKRLLEMACPEPVINGRMINYPADMYMTLIDHRDEQERKTGKKRDFVPPYSDVLHRIKMTRQQLNARRGDLSEAMRMSKFVNSDYEESELRAYNAQFSQSTMKRREPVRSSTERADALRTLYDMTDACGSAAAQTNWKSHQSVAQQQQQQNNHARTPKSTKRSRKT
jgi:hypothetical protein